MRGGVRVWGGRFTSFRNLYPRESRGRRLHGSLVGVRVDRELQICGCGGGIGRVGDRSRRLQGSGMETVEKDLQVYVYRLYDRIYGAVTLVAGL